MSVLTPRVNDLESRDTQTDGKIAKNYIINGAMDFWQRGTSSFSVAASFTYSADRFRAEAGGSNASGSIERSTDVPSNSFDYSAFVTNNGGSIGNSSDAFVIQGIESNLMRELSGKVVKFSCWIKTENLQAGTEIFLGGYTPTNGDDDWSGGSNGRMFTNDLVFIENITSQVSGSWTKISYSFTCPDQSVTNKGLAIGISVTKLAILSVVDESIYTTGWMLTEDTGEPDFDPEFQRAGRDIVEEKNLCKRYFERIDFGVNYYGAHYTSVPNTFFGEPIFFEVEKRATPVCSFIPISGSFYWVIAGTTSVSASDTTGISVTATNTKICRMTQPRIAGGSAPVNAGYYLYEAAWYINAEAEL